MPLILPGNVAAATASTVYSIANSCRFNDGDSPSLEKTSGTPTSGVKGTFSFWFKRGELGTSATKYFISTNDISTPYFQMYIGTSSAQQDSIRVQVFTGGTTTELITSRKFRDPSSWYHCVFSYDSTPSTPSSSSIRLFINGVQETAFSTETYPSQNAGHNFEEGNIMVGAANSGPENFFDGYLAEFVYCDGQAYAASDFGEFDSDSPTIWKPKDVSGLTFGDEGFWLDFEASANLGNDANGGTDLSEVNIAAIDQCTDSPTNNFCTINPIANSYYGNNVFSEGNCKVTWDGDQSARQEMGTFGLTAGKWYWEWKMTDMASEDTVIFGIVDRPTINTNDYLAGLPTSPYFASIYGYGFRSGTSTTEVYNQNSAATSGFSIQWDNDDDGIIVGCALDLDNNKIYFHRAGTWGGSGDPAAGSNGISITAATSTTGGQYFPVFGTRSSHDYVNEMNFGNPSFTGTDQADDNGYGSFEYDVPAGFYAICSKNLGEFGG